MHKKMIVTWIMILLPGLLQAFEYKGTRLYKEYGADENISQFIRESLKNSPDLQELFVLGEQDYKKFVDDRILQDYSIYFDGVSTGQGDSFYGANADVGQEILKIHDQAVAHISPLIRKKIEPKLHKVLFDILQDSSKNIEKINKYSYRVASNSSVTDKAADEILNYAVLHRKLNFEIYPVLEFMIKKENYKPSVMQFIVDNFTITQKVTGVDRVFRSGCIQITPLIKACEDISEQGLLRVKFLISCKAYIDGNLLLIVACKNEGAQAFNIIQYLVEKGADVNRQNKNGETPLMIACYNKGPEAFNMVQYLVEKGADLNAQGPEKFTLLVIACANRGSLALDIVQYLVEKGADLNAQNQDGLTLLMIACSNKGAQAFNIVHYLLDCGADRNLRTLHYGLTAFYFAQTQEIKNLLNNYQPKVS